jgi:aryl-alcohol dehydrogenase-like predicted oxidoreductase
MAIEYRVLGRTGMKVSPLCLGTMMFGAKTELEESLTIIDKSIDAGINFLDTANVYSRGRSEDFVGQALVRNKKRNYVVLATKVHGRMDDSDPNASSNHRRHIIEQCEASLKRLQTDWIDLYQIHRPQSEIPIDETLRALDDLIRGGKVRYIGTSTFAAWQLVDSLWASKDLHLNRFVCEQPPYHLLDRRIERELIPMSQTYGFGLIPWSPLAGGLLTGKYKKDQPRTEGRWKQGQEPAGRKVSPAAYDAIEAVTALAAAKGCSPSQLSIAWCMQQPGITSPIIGPRTMEQYDDNIAALSVSITEEDRKKLDEICPPGRMLVPYYEADFGPSRHRW